MIIGPQLGLLASQLLAPVNAAVADLRESMAMEVTSQSSRGERTSGLGAPGEPRRSRVRMAESAHAAPRAATDTSLERDEFGRPLESAPQVGTSRAVPEAAPVSPERVVPPGRPPISPGSPSAPERAPISPGSPSAPERAPIVPGASSPIRIPVAGRLAIRPLFEAPVPAIGSTSSGSNAPAPVRATPAADGPPALWGEAPGLEMSSSLTTEPARPSMAIDRRALAEAMAEVLRDEARRDGVDC